MTIRVSSSDGGTESIADGKGATAMDEACLTGSDISDDEDVITIATHFVKVPHSGAVSDVSTLWDLVGTEVAEIRESGHTGKGRVRQTTIGINKHI